MFEVAVAHSLELDSADAVADLLDQCYKQLGDLKPQAAIMFAGIDHDHALVLEKIYEVYPDMDLIGGTTDGELSSVHGCVDDSITLMAFCSDDLTFKTGVVDNISKGTTNAVSKGVHSVVSNLEQEPELCIAIHCGIIPGGGVPNYEKILQGLKGSLGENFPVFGGGASDQLRLNRTYQFYHDSVLTDALVFLLISGPLLYSFGVETGQIPIGTKEQVIKSDDNIVYKIGNQKAALFYRRYLGEDIGKLDKQIILDFPLAVFEDDDEHYYARAVMINNDDSSLTTVGNVPEGSMVQITHTTRDEIVESAARSVGSSLIEYPGTDPVAALCFSARMRKQVLGSRFEEEYLAFKNERTDLPVAGFYAYGEIAPLERGEPAKSHNTMIVSLILGVK